MRKIVLSLVFATVASFSLPGRVALVTGSSGGIGKSIALRLKEEGVRVCLHYNTRKEEAEEVKRLLGPDYCLGIVQCDFRFPDKLFEFMSDVEEICDGGVDILVNNAGAVNKLALEDDEDLSIWHETLAVNLHAPYTLSKLALPKMKMNGRGGVIINISSIHGEVSNEYMGAYAASKSALDSLTRTMACPSIGRMVIPSACGRMT